MRSCCFLPAGVVALVVALSGSGLNYVRCEKHYQDYLERVGPKIAETRRRYPDSDTPPGWFDASYAGEHWNDD